VPIAFVWANATEVLLKLGQSTEIANLSGVYMRCLTPGLLFYAWNISVQTYMQSQRITKPSAVAGVVAAVFHVPLNYLFIFQFGWGYKGAAIATSTSNGVVLAMNVGYLRFWKKDGVDDDDKTSLRTPRENTTTWTGWSVSAATSEWRPFLRLALPGILMMAEWWASELNIILAGWLPDPERNVAAVSIFQITRWRLCSQSGSPSPRLPG
jgi:multidrug resistance protein, MATE family